MRLVGVADRLVESDKNPKEQRKRMRIGSGVFLAVLMAAAMTAMARGEETAKVSPAPHFEFVFEEQVGLASDVPFAATPFGKHNIIPITGGSFAGEKLKGKVLAGGWDWQTMTATGCFTLHADYFIQTEDGVPIHVVNEGTLCKNSAGVEVPLITRPVLEAPTGKYDWLNGGLWASTVDGMTLDGKPAVRIRIYQAK